MRLGVGVCEPHVHEQFRNGEGFRVNFRNGFRERFFLRGGKGGGMLDFVERHDDCSGAWVDWKQLERQMEMSRMELMMMLDKEVDFLKWEMNLEREEKE